MSTKTQKPKKKVKKTAKKGAGHKKGAESPMYSRTSTSGGLLTPRQEQILRLGSLGCSTREIALVLNIAPSTVDNHKMAASKALGVGKAPLLVRKLIAMKITKPEDRLTKSELDKLGGGWTDGWNRT